MLHVSRLRGGYIVPQHASATDGLGTECANGFALGEAGVAEVSETINEIRTLHGTPP
ncbi:MAG: hypothetical protein QHI38_07295 [Armatimonadota bacterium]|nr:hypothetical protein [Armatimonadota bacterium]